MRTSIAAPLAPRFAEEQDPDANPQTVGTGAKNPDTRREPVQPEPGED